jgi:hypothetical protein
MTFPLQLLDKNRKPESLHFKGLMGFFYPFLLQKSGYIIDILTCQYSTAALPQMPVKCRLQSLKPRLKLQSSLILY